MTTKEVIKSLEVIAERLASVYEGSENIEDICEVNGYYACLSDLKKLTGNDLSK